MNEGLLGVLATIAGVILGSGIEFYKTNATNKEEEEYILHTILSFLKPEIEYNYNVVGLSRSKDLAVEKRYYLAFSEYQAAKYQLLKKPSEVVKEVINLYQLFQEYTLIPDHDRKKQEKKKGDIKVQKEILDQLI